MSPFHGMRNAGREADGDLTCRRNGGEHFVNLRGQPLTRWASWRYTRLRMERKRKAIKACTPRGADDEQVPIWRHDPDILAQLEAIGRRLDYVERIKP